MSPRPLALALAASALALLPATASAKEVVKAQVCGADGCRTVGHAIAMDLMDGGPPTDPPREAAPFFTAKLTMRVEDGKLQTFETAFVPRYGLMRGDDGTWMDAPVQTETAFKRAAAGVGAAFGAEKLDLSGPSQPQAQVSEVVRAPADPAPVDDGTSPWLIAGVVIAAALAMTALVALVLKRRGSEGTPPAAPSPPGG
jgi:hypothetical protein